MEEIDEINKCKYNVNGSCKLEILTPCGLVPSKDCYYKQLLRKEKECEELKEKNKNLQKIGLEEWLTGANKYKQALQEIKEIAETRDYLSLDECLDDILQKISEVK